MMEKNSELKLDKPIDLVYMWVDGQDPAWLAKKTQYCGQSESSKDDDLSGDCRYQQFDELKYSLRSAEKFAPWINHIYIVTDNQSPRWLDPNNKKVTIVDHREIIDEKYLPLFNSTSIELNLAKIPGLSEHFLLANDDTFFGRPVTPDFFFTPDGKAIFRSKYKDIVHGFSHYQDLLWDAREATLERGIKCTAKAPHHNIDAYIKSQWLECVDHYKDWYETTMTHRQRTAGDMHRHLISLWTMEHGKGVEKIVGKKDGLTTTCRKIAAALTLHYAADSRYMSIRKPSLRFELWYHNPALFVINDDRKARLCHRRRMVRMMQRLFPEPSSFEFKFAAPMGIDFE